MSMKKQLLDPLGTMCKIIALNFREKNTKISIQDHVLTLQDPTTYQWAIRFINGDGKENVGELYYAVIRIIKWYLVCNDEHKSLLINKHNQTSLSNLDEKNSCDKYHNKINDDDINYGNDMSNILTDNYDNEHINNHNEHDYNGHNHSEHDQNIINKNNNKIKQKDIEHEYSDQISCCSNHSIPTTKMSEIDENIFHNISEGKNSEKLIDNLNSVSIANSEEFRLMVIYLCNALRKLQETYEYGNVVLALQFYINILEDALKGEFDETKLPKYIIDRENEYNNLLDYNKIKNFWTIENLKKIHKYYDKCFNVKNKISKENGKFKDVDNKIREVEIEGYLKSVDSILNAIDDDFQELVHNNYRG